MKLHELVNHVRDEGDARRRMLDDDNPWMPPADSHLWDVYRQYCEETGRPAGTTVGRCHFWHVVLVFSPLRKFAKRLSTTVGVSFLSALAALAAFILLEVVLTTSGGIHWWVAPLVVFGSANLIGLVAGICIYAFGLSDDSSFLDIVSEVLDDNDKMSWGMAAMLVAGPGLMLGLTGAYYVHNTVRVVGKLSVTGTVLDFLAEYGGRIFKTLFMIAAAVALGICAYIWGIKPYGWLEMLKQVGIALGAVLAICVFAMLVGFTVTKAISNVQERREARTQALVATSQEVVEKPKFSTRVSESIKTVFWKIWDVVRLVIEVFRSGYKQACPLVAVPPTGTADKSADPVLA